jgi:hypothetical protein
LDALRTHTHDVKTYTSHTENKVNPLENARVELYKAVKNFTDNDK